MTGQAIAAPLALILRCDERHQARARYVFDTLLCALGVPVCYPDAPPAEGPWLLYSLDMHGGEPNQRALWVPHSPEAWIFLDGCRDIETVGEIGGLAVPLPQRSDPGTTAHNVAPEIAFDLPANAFYFLASWSERRGRPSGSSRTLFTNSVFARLGLPQNMVDRYLRQLELSLHALCARLHHPGWPKPEWPGGSAYAIVLSHDIDFLPAGSLDIAVQGAKTIARHLLRQRDPGDAMRALWGLLRAMAVGRDPYGCVPEILAGERALGVRSSFQVAVSHRHPNDVNYDVEDDRTRDYLLAIVDAGFDLCLHGSYRSTENAEWYAEEVEKLARRLVRPAGSRQHFLSFDYDVLFQAQERSGVRFDMSVGYPDRTGPRAGFSHPYCPYDLEGDRPYRVVEIPLVLMDVTLRSYMGLKGEAAWAEISRTLESVRACRGCISTVWHPIVFGGARDPGDSDLYWSMVKGALKDGAMATDGRAIDLHWRSRAREYPTFRWA